MTRPSSRASTCPFPGRPCASSSPCRVEVLQQIVRRQLDLLLELNQRSVDEELPAKTIAADWLKSVDLD